MARRPTRTRKLSALLLAGVLLLAAVQGTRAGAQPHGQQHASTAAGATAPSAQASARSDQPARPTADRRPPPTAHRRPPGPPAGKLSVSGNRLLDDGRPIVLHGINYFGFNNAQTMVDGLWAGARRAALCAPVHWTAMPMLQLLACRAPRA